MPTNAFSLCAKPVELPADVPSVELARSELAQQMPILPPGFTPGVQRYRTYIRLNTPSYREDAGRPGFMRAEAKSAWERESREIIKAAGMVDKYSSARTGAAVRAHAHPDEFSGEWTPEEADQLLAVVRRQATLSTVRAIDIYGLEEEISPTEARLRCDYYKEDLVNRVMSRFATSRRNTFKAMGFAWSAFDDLPGLSLGGGAGLEAAIDYCKALIDNLLERGWLIVHPTEAGYCRAANNAELRELRRLECSSGLNA